VSIGGRSIFAEGTAHRGRRRCHRILRGRSGNGLLELALVMPLLLAMALGMVEFGQYFYIKHTFESAARDGCRVAISSAATQSQVVARVTAVLSGSNITYNSSWLAMTDTTSNTTVTDVATVPAGHFLKIQISTVYDQLPTVVRPLYAMTHAGIGTGKTVKGTTIMVKE
jgi:Flp pilus assembly protein TadG